LALKGVWQPYIHVTTFGHVEFRKYEKLGPK